MRGATPKVELIHDLPSPICALNACKASYFELETKLWEGEAPTPRNNKTGLLQSLISDNTNGATDLFPSRSAFNGGLNHATDTRVDHMNQKPTAMPSLWAWQIEDLQLS